MDPLNLQATTENDINPLQVKELFCKEILPDLSYNNYGYDTETIEKLKSLSKKIITKPLHFDYKRENLTETTVDKTSEGTSSIDWMEVDKDLNCPDGYGYMDFGMAELHQESSIESAEEEENEPEGDTSINAILEKYNIPDRVYSTQELICRQESEQLYCFRESQLIDVFGDAGSDPLADNSITKIQNETSDYDEYDHLCDGGRLPEILNNTKPLTTSLETAHRPVTLKRNSSSLSDINFANNFDEKGSELSSPKRIRMSYLLEADYHLSSSDAETRQIESDSPIQQVKEKSLENNGHEAAEESGNNFVENSNKEDGSNDSNITEHNGAVQKSTDEIVAELQKRLDEAKSNDEIQKILDEGGDYLSMLVFPYQEPDIQVVDEPEKKEEDKNENSNTVEESRTVKNIQEPKVQPALKTFARKLKNARPKLSYDNTESSDSISLEDSSNPLLMNDTVLSGSHKDCIGIVKDLELVSSTSNLSTSCGSSRSSHLSNSILFKDHSNNHPTIQQSPKENAAVNMLTEEEIIERLQALIDAAESPEEINRILIENEQYRYDIIIPFKEPELPQDAQSSFAKPTQKVNQESQNVQKQAKTKNNLERSSSRIELSFLLDQNVNIQRKKAAVPQPKEVDEIVAIDLIDDDD